MRIRNAIIITDDDGSTTVWVVADALIQCASCNGSQRTHERPDPVPRSRPRRTPPGVVARSVASARERAPGPSFALVPADAPPLSFISDPTTVRSTRTGPLGRQG